MKKSTIFCIVISLIAIIALICALIFLPNDDKTEAPVENSAGDALSQELTPAKIKENDESTETAISSTLIEHVVDNLHYKTPSNFVLDENSGSGIQYNLNLDEKSYIITVADAEYETGTEQVFMSSLRAIHYGLDESSYEKMSEQKEETINGVKWYVVKLEIPTDESGQYGYAELLYSFYNGRVYSVGLYQAFSSFMPKQDSIYKNGITDLASVKEALVFAE